MRKRWISEGLIEDVRVEREKNPQVRAADIARHLGKSREAIRQALVGLGLPTTRPIEAKFCSICGEKLKYGCRTGRCQGCYFPPKVKDAVVRDYLRGDKVEDIYLEHKMAKGSMYVILRSRSVKLRGRGHTQRR